MKTVTHAFIWIPGDEDDLFVLNVDTDTSPYISIAKNTLKRISS